MTARRGYFMADALVGLVLISVLAGSMAVLVNRHNRACAKMADSRAAVRLAERALAEVQAGQAPAAAPASSPVRVQVKRAPVEQSIPGMVWLEATAEVQGQRAVLLGVAREEAARKGGVQ